MEIRPFVVTSTGMAFGPCIQECADFLVEKSLDFGSAVSLVELYLHCESADEMNPRLEFMVDRFNDQIKSLPKIWFRRKKHQIDISFRSQWIHRKEFFGSKHIKLCDNEFQILCKELADAFCLIEKRIKRSDSFETARFLEHINSQLEKLATQVHNRGITNG